MTNCFRWTIEKQHEGMQQFLSWDFGFNKDGYGSVMERYWLASNGVAIFVRDDSPLHFGIVDKQLCFKADYRDSWYPNPENKPAILDYSICMAKDVKAVHKYMIDTFMQKPESIPDKIMIKFPIWSTWAKYKMDIDQEKTLTFAKEIIVNGFRGSQIEIDDKYTTTYGDHKFDPKKFPNPKEMIKAIETLGFRVTSWVHPFVNVDSKAFQTGMKHGYFVKDSRGVEAIVRWWQGKGALLDVTNPDAMKWYHKRLSVIKQVGMTSFKFDAGESNFLPDNFQTHAPLRNPNYYGKYWADYSARQQGKSIEVRVGYKSQNLPVFVRMMDKESRWDYEQGLKTLIPNALHFGIIGYPFILPDMIGGNAYGANNSVWAGSPTHGDLPDKELYIRWLQLNTFLPAMQFSITPWQYDEETVKIAKKFTGIHVNYATIFLISLARNAMDTGDPIIRPLWWIDPTDEKTYDIESEFLVGEYILVAPILDKGARSRDIYLPAGEWKEMLREEKVYTGKQTLKDYRVDLDELAYFEKIIPEVKN